MRIAQISDRNVRIFLLGVICLHVRYCANVHCAASLQIGYFFSVGETITGNRNLGAVKLGEETKVLRSGTWPEHKLDTVEETRVQCIPKYNSLMSSDG